MSDMVHAYLVEGFNFEAESELNRRMALFGWREKRFHHLREQLDMTERIHAIVSLLEDPSLIRVDVSFFGQNDTKPVFGVYVMYHVVHGHVTAEGVL